MCWGGWRSSTGERCGPGRRGGGELAEGAESVGVSVGRMWGVFVSVAWVVVFVEYEALVPGKIRFMGAVGECFGGECGGGVDPVLWSWDGGRVCGDVTVPEV